MPALTAFEAAARLASFTRAAAELGVTQAAVSRQVHHLEEHLGFALFHRLHRRVELTAKGRSLAMAAGEAFDQIASSVAEVSRDSQDGELTISATVAFSHFWLLPRISEFSRQHPQINLRIVTQDKLANVDTGEFDLAIRFGSGMWTDGQAELLFEDEIFPICSPDYARATGGLATPEDIAAHPLISNDADDPTWIGWNEWLAAFSVKPPRRSSGLRCSFYTEAIYAALDGQGIALGWRRLVEGLITQNRLVQVTDSAVTTRNAYFIVIPKSRKPGDAVLRFLAWMRLASREPVAGLKLV